ncbi:unnamed protein product, partial [Prorocentrum cordatum]
MKLKRFMLMYEPPGIGLEVQVLALRTRSRTDPGSAVMHKVAVMFPGASERHRLGWAPLVVLVEFRVDSFAVGGSSPGQDVYRLVDDLIASETPLLTRRRHRPALVKLLGRLYQVEVSDADAGDEGADTMGRKASPPVPTPQLQEGCSVVFIAMQNKLREHNGETGTIQKVFPEKGKFEVMLASQEVLKVKGTENMVPLAPQ